MMMNARGPQGECHEIGVRYVFACVFMPGGHLVLACGTSGLILLDKNFRLVRRLEQITARNVCVMNDVEILVTKGSARQLQFLQILPEVVPGTAFRTDRNCYGIDVHNDVIYITCHDAPGNGEIRALDKNGQLLKTIGNEGGQILFKQPDYVKVNKTGDKLFVSDAVTNTVTCLDNLGHVIYRCNDEGRLANPKGMLVDSGDNVYVCGHKSNSIDRVCTNGMISSVSLTKRNGVEFPLCLAVRNTDNCLVVGLLGKDKPLIAFHNTTFVQVGSRTLDLTL